MAANLGYPLPHNLLPGSYRIVDDIEVGGEKHELATRPFKVIRHDFTAE
jgi:hypothetical protein